MTAAPTRRALAGGALAASAWPTWARAAGGDPLDGARLSADVAAYDAMGEHRTGGAADAACSAWLQRRLAAAGFEAALQPFAAPRFTPALRRVSWPGGALEAFPAWPVRTTPPGGLAARLATAAEGRLDGRIAVVRLPYGLDAAWAVPRLHAPVQDALARGAVAVVAVTEGPTGQAIALNAPPGGAAWSAPVVLAGSSAAAPLLAAAASGAAGRLQLDGAFDPGAQATNVVARRRGEGRTIVVSTPKSGWFRCAGERGGGLAILLALAEALAARTRRDLLVLATSGHELGYAGGADLLRVDAPPPAQVAVWLHLGANLALQEVAIAPAPPGSAAPARVVGLGATRIARSLTLSPGLEGAGRRAFAGVEGYAAPKVFTPAAALGELELFRRAGYGAALAGMIGSSPLFHTRADRAAVATTPQVLAPVAAGALRFLTLAG